MIVSKTLQIEFFNFGVLNFTSASGKRYFDCGTIIENGFVRGYPQNFCKVNLVSLIEEDKENSKLIDQLDEVLNYGDMEELLYTQWIDESDLPQLIPYFKENFLESDLFLKSFVRHFKLNSSEALERFIEKEINEIEKAKEELLKKEVVVKRMMKAMN